MKSHPYLMIEAYDSCERSIGFISIGFINVNYIKMISPYPFGDLKAKVITDMETDYTYKKCPHDDHRQTECFLKISCAEFLDKYKGVE